MVSIPNLGFSHEIPQINSSRRFVLMATRPSRQCKSLTSRPCFWTICGSNRTGLAVHVARSFDMRVAKAVGDVNRLFVLLLIFLYKIAVFNNVQCGKLQRTERVYPLKTIYFVKFWSTHALMLQKLTATPTSKTTVPLQNYESICDENRSLYVRMKLFNIEVRTNIYC